MKYKIGDQVKARGRVLTIIGIDCIDCGDGEQAEYWGQPDPCIITRADGTQYTCTVPFTEKDIETEGK